MAKPKTTTAEQLGAAQLAISNSQNDAEIMALVGGYGYSPEKLAQGQALFAAAQAAVSAQGAAAGSQQAATVTFNEAKAAAFDAFQALAKVARATLPPAALTVLGLTSSMPRSTDAFRAAASQLFDNAASVPELAQFGYDAARISAERAKITAYESANQSQEAAKSAAQQATREQDAALKALNQWTAQYIKIARVALRGQPELLEKLGVRAS